MQDCEGGRKSEGYGGVGGVETFSALLEVGSGLASGHRQSKVKDQWRRRGHWQVRYVVLDVMKVGGEAGLLLSSPVGR